MYPLHTERMLESILWQVNRNTARAAMRTVRVAGSLDCLGASQ
jgi:hypothetical protein